MLSSGRARVAVLVSGPYAKLMSLATGDILIFAKHIRVVSILPSTVNLHNKSNRPQCVSQKGDLFFGPQYVGTQMSHWWKHSIEIKFQN